MPLSQLAITQKNQDCLNILMNEEKKYFSDEKGAAQFAAVYLIRNFDVSKVTNLPLDKYTSSFTNNKWHLNDLDSDYFIRNSLILFDNRIEDTDLALRSAVSIGLDKIYEKINDVDWTIISLV